MDGLAPARCVLVVLLQGNSIRATARMTGASGNSVAKRRMELGGLRLRRPAQLTCEEVVALLNVDHAPGSSN